MSGKEGRTYGLILKKKPSATLVFSKPSIFGGDNSSDEEKEGRQNVNNTIKKEAEKNKQMRQTQMEIDKVLEEDPTAYEYDKVYDEMAEKKASIVAAKTAVADKKPKYIVNLLKFAEARKKEEERRVERQVQKEREAEGNEFADKDAFVTSAYRKKMQEMAEEEERQRRLDELETDVTKQADLSMFYRNLLDKNVSTVGRHNTEEPTKADGRRSAIDQGSSRAVIDENESNKTLKKVKHSKNDDWERGVYEDSRGNKMKEHRENDKSLDMSEERREKRSDKFDIGVEKGQRKVSFETCSRRPEKEEKVLRNTMLGESRRDEERRREGERDETEKDKEKAEDREEKVGGEASTIGDDQKMEETKGSELKRSVQLNEKADTTLIDEKRKKESGKNATSKFAKHSSTETVLSARERYFARKRARVAIQPTSEEEDD